MRKNKWIFKILGKQNIMNKKMNFWRTMIISATVYKLIKECVHSVKTKNKNSKSSEMICQWELENIILEAFLRIYLLIKISVLIKENQTNGCEKKLSFMVLIYNLEWDCHLL
jgi:hypothetical protein